MAELRDGLWLKVTCRGVRLGILPQGREENIGAAVLDVLLAEAFSTDMSPKTLGFRRGKRDFMGS